jgi:phosphotransferase system enzyme I (PtsP)
MSIDRPALIRMQARALLKASAGRPLIIMFPMIADLDEFLAAKALFMKEVSRAESFGHKTPKTIKFGAMLEVPALAWRITSLKGHCDFLSIGTNDLLQFYFACDRGNPRIANRYDRLSPSALSFLRFILEQSRAAGITTTICGEMASRPLEAMALLGLGFRTLSIAAPQIGVVKLMLRSLEVSKLTEFLLPKLFESTPSLRKDLKSFALRENILV